jgi:hypothetical protein
LGLSRHAQRLAHGIRIEIESGTNALEGVRPTGMVREEPVLRLVEEPVPFLARGRSIRFKAIERVVKDRDHEPSFGYLLMPRSEMLRRQENIELHQAAESIRRSSIRFDRHVLPLEEWKAAP